MSQVISTLQMLPVLHDFVRDPARVIAKLCDQHGDLFCVRFGKTHRFVTRHPDHIREALVDKAASFIRPEQDLNVTARYFRYCLGNGLLASNGELWRRQRRMINPALHKKRIEGHAATMVNSARSMVDGWRDGQSLDVGVEMTRLNVAILAQSLFEHGAPEQVGELLQLLATLHKTFGTTSLLLLPAWVRVPSELRFRRSIRRVDKIIYDMIDARRALGEDALAQRGDLLSALILATDDEATAPDERHMTRRLLRDELLTLYLAGSDTTSNALSWTFYLLSQHPAIEARLIAEVDAALDERPATLDDLKRLPYGEMVLCEAMRLYPPGPVFARTAAEDVEIGGQLIPAGSELSFWVYLAHRDRRWHPDPESFVPERFARDAPAPPRGAYIPFGIGNRICIGREFAMTEARLALATVLQRFSLELVPGQTITPNFAITLSPRHGLRMRLHRRQNQRSPRC